MTAKSETVGVVAWPDNRVNMPDPHEPDARIVGFRIRPGHPWYGLGLSDPLFALRDAVDAAKAAEQKHATLISGLEALAGRLGPAGDPKDRFDEGYDAACEMWRAQIRTLIPAAANTESEEV